MKISVLKVQMVIIALTILAIQSYSKEGNDAYFWTSTIYETDDNGAPIPRFYNLTKDSGNVSTNTGGSINAKTGMSVRCIKN